MHGAPDRVYVKDVPVWTPFGQKKWSGYLGASIEFEKTPEDVLAKARILEAAAEKYPNEDVIVNLGPGGIRNLIDFTLPQAQRYAAEKGGNLPSAGLWHKARDATGDIFPRYAPGLEYTSTLVKYNCDWNSRRRQARGLIIQNPLANEDGTDFIRDANGIPVVDPKDGYILEATLPVGTWTIGDMPAGFGLFLNTVYGLPNARKQLPSFTPVNAPYGFDYQYSDENSEFSVLCTSNIKDDTEMVKYTCNLLGLKFTHDIDLWSANKRQYVVGVRLFYGRARLTSLQ